MGREGLGEEETEGIEPAENETEEYLSKNSKVEVTSDEEVEPECDPQINFSEIDQTEKKYFEKNYSVEFAHKENETRIDETEVDDNEENDLEEVETDNEKHKLVELHLESMSQFDTNNCQDKSIVKENLEIIKQRITQGNISDNFEVQETEKTGEETKPTCTQLLKINKMDYVKVEKEKGQESETSFEWKEVLKNTNKKGIEDISKSVFSK